MRSQQARTKFHLLGPTWTLTAPKDAATNNISYTYNFGLSPLRQGSLRHEGKCCHLWPLEATWPAFLVPSISPKNGPLAVKSHHFQDPSFCFFPLKKPVASPPGLRAMGANPACFPHRLPRQQAFRTPPDRQASKNRSTPLREGDLSGSGQRSGGWERAFGAAAG